MEITNYSNGKDSNEKVSWRLNEPNNKLLFQKCGSIIKLKLQKHLRQNLNLIRVHSNGSTFGQSTRFCIDFNTMIYGLLFCSRKLIGTLNGEVNLWYMINLSRI